MEAVHSKKHKWWLRPAVWAFVIPVVSLLILYAVKEVFPFGNRIYVRMDFYHQYAPFVKEFCRRISEGESLLYAWEYGLGTNYWAHYAYYLASPVNWILALVPESFVIEAMNVTMVLRAGCAGVTFVYFLKEQHKENMAMAVFGIFYALSGYYIAYACNIIWMDGYALFPLAALGVLRIAKGKSAVCYTVSMLICTFSNFYLAVIIGICCVFWLAICLFTGRKKSVKRVFAAIGRFTLATLLFISICAVILLPVALALANTPAGESAFPEKTEFYFAFYQLLERMCMNTDSVLKGSDLPNLYASVLVLLLLPMYFGNKTVRIRDKVVYGLALLFLLISFELNYLDYIWHGLHFPNSFPARQSFFYIFLVLGLGYEAYVKRRKLQGKIVYPVIALALVGILWIVTVINDQSAGLMVYLCTFIFLAVYGVLFCCEKVMPPKLFLGLLLGICCVECGMNLGVSGLDSLVSRTAYTEDDPETELLLSEIMPEENTFYRMEELDRRTVNDAGWDGYYGGSYFSSTMPGGVKEWYDAFGMRNSSVSYSYDGATPLVSSLLGVRYVFASEEAYRPGNTFTESDRTTESETMFLYENQTVLPLGYVVPEHLEEQFRYHYSNPFITQNSFAKAVLQEPVVLFTPVEQYEEIGVPDFDTGAGAENSTDGGEDAKKQFYIDIPEGANVFLYVTTYMEAIEVEITELDSGISEVREYDDLNFKKILSLGVSDVKRRIKITSADASVKDFHFYSYEMNEEVLRRICAALGSQPMELHEFSETKLIGSIDVQEEGVLLLSIPYDAGWSIKVDGKEAEAFPWKDAFLGLKLETGYHEIEFSYCPEGLKEGLVISVLGCLTALLYMCGSRKKQKRKQIKP